MRHLCVWTSQIHPLYPLHYSNDAKFVQMTQQISCASDTIGVVEVGRIYGRFTPAFTFSITIANETDGAIFAIQKIASVSRWRVTRKFVLFLFSSGEYPAGGNDAPVFILDFILIGKYIVKKLHTCCVHPFVDMLPFRISRLHASGLPIL